MRETTVVDAKMFEKMREEILYLRAALAAEIAEPAPQSRSVLRRPAIQKGDDMPMFENEPAPDLPLLQHVVEVCPTLAGSGLVIALHMWVYTYGQKCYAAGRAAKRVVLEAALKASDAMLNEYIDKLRALESKRAPMTLSACGTLYAKHLKFGGPDYAAIQAIREASSGLTLAQAREMALGCVKHPLVFESGDQELDQAFLDGQQWMRSSVLAAIESAFKEPNT